MVRRLFVSTAALGLLFVGAQSASGQVQLAQVGAFNVAMYATSPPGDSSRLFVVEQAGVIRVVRDGTTLPEPFLDIDADVRAPGGEEGLLSMAFAPDYATSRRFYVYYTSSDGANNYVDEFLRSESDLDRADPASRRRVLELDHTDHGNHNGGLIAFGPDGYLYIGTGDGGGGNDTEQNAQRLTGDPFNNDGANPLLGKILRIDPREAGSAPYTVPADNPFVGSTGGERPEIWSWGLRNPWRWSFDRSTGDLVLGDVGQGEKEEIDFDPSPNRGRGINWGWVCFEGTRTNTDAPPGSPCPPASHKPPLFEHDQDDPEGFRAIVGGYVIRDTSLGEPFTGRYIYGDNSYDGLRTVDLTSPSTTNAERFRLSGLTSFGEDACGRVYAVTFARVYRLQATPPAACSLPSPYPAVTAPPPPPPPGGGDAEAPAVRLTAARRQRVLRKRGAVLGMRCSEACTLLARGRFSAPGRAARVFRLRPASRTASAGQRVRAKLRLRPKARRALRRAHARGRRPLVRVTVVATDAAGNASSARRRIRAVR